MGMERRDELLQAAARVYAMHGYRGSTTRRIADEAGVNEITIFRQFGTKDALIHEAIASCGGSTAPSCLPQIPVDPLTELQQWARCAHAHITSNRALIRRCMSERDEHPQLIASANRGPVHAMGELQGYLSRLQEHGLAEERFDTRAPAAMFMGALFSFAMGCDTMPELYPTSTEGAIQAYTQILLRGIRVDVTGKPERASRHTEMHGPESDTGPTGKGKRQRPAGGSGSSTGPAAPTTGRSRMGRGTDRSHT